MSKPTRMTKNCKVSNFGANFFGELLNEVGSFGGVLMGTTRGDQRPTQDRTLDFGQPRSTEWCHQVREKVKLMRVEVGCGEKSWKTPGIGL